MGIVIRRYREASGFAQDVFAAKAGIDRSYYGKIERGERQPSVGVLLRIARAMNVPGARMLEDTETLLSRTRTTSQRDETA